MLYTFPNLGRFGLAHSLLAWGRASVWAKMHGAVPLAPDWFKLRLGPYLRGERDKRNYFLLFGNGNAVGGIRKRFLMLRLPKIEEQHLHVNPSELQSSAVIVFKSLSNNNISRDFGALRNHSAFLKSELVAMTQSRFHPPAEHRSHIAVHVRLGDFALATEDELRAGKQNARLPLEWYTHAMYAVRSALNWEVPMKIYSDGSDQELARLLAVPGTERSPTRAAITDMLAISNAAALIGSGSGFSLWGSFLGQVPRISYPGQLLVKVLDEPSQEITLAVGEALPHEFVAALARNMPQPSYLDIDACAA